MRFEPVNSCKELRQHLAEEILRKRAIFISTKLSAGLITAQHKNMSLVPPALQMSRQTGPESSEHILLSVLVGRSAQAAITETTGWGGGGFHSGSLFSHSSGDWKSKIDEKCWQIWFLGGLSLWPADTQSFPHVCTHPCIFVCPNSFFL